jgi:hypothetical protein
MIDETVVRHALVESQASIIVAARKLGVPRIELRRLITRNPELMAAALEAAERDMDKAEQILRDGMDSQDRMKRLEAAALILKSRFRARR